ncbi:5583_t:CDS:2 [Funneliformis caledonium]|uniref:5583_t:CDS:1 n=1 Tax=Funneliformis caledonium TaxID=1117310 RepID=A0A9N9NSF8_9GLOM|nr:5583_t:CDS:2 [Funneliformis caledonium]
MSSNNFEGEMLQSEDPKETLNPKANGSKRPRQRTQKPLKRQRLTSHIDLNKITDYWIWGYFDQYKPVRQYKRVVRCLVQVQRKNGAELCDHFLGSDNSTGNFIVYLAIHRITKESHERKMNEIRNNNQVSQPCIDEMIRNNPNIKVIETENLLES